MTDARRYSSSSHGSWLVGSVVEVVDSAFKVPASVRFEFMVTRNCSDEERYIILYEYHAYRLMKSNIL
jgi:hypothetical protein